MAKLQHRATFDIPLREVSGLCVRSGADGRDVLVAIGDARGTAVWTDMSTGVQGDWHEVDLAARSGGRIPSRDCQAEAIASDGAGTMVVMLEEPARLVVAPAGDGPVLGIDLVVPAADPLSGAWNDDPNSRGEGLVLLAGGHVLVVKEKRPCALLEFGPAGHVPVGIGDGALVGSRGTWSPPGADGPFDLLATWPLDDSLADEVGDLSDAAVDHRGRLVVVSDQSSRVVVLAPAGPSGTPVAAAAVLKIQGSPDKAEGLAVLADGTVLVALDRPEPKHNLLVLDGLGAD